MARRIVVQYFIGGPAGNVPCPRCGARVGAACKTRGGKPARELHEARWDAYDAQRAAKAGSERRTAPRDPMAGAEVNPAQLDPVEHGSIPLSREDGADRGVQPVSGRGEVNREGQVISRHRVWRHKKRGSLYTIVGLAGGIVYYVAHADGGRWHRPEGEFWDGRYEPADEAPLSAEDAGFARG